ncbi:MAG: anaerobic ribonucleoside-triphosphate reductase [archaeon]
MYEIENVKEEVEARTGERVVPCEVYSRVVGYHRPVQFWNKGKYEEFKQRKAYDTEVSMKSDKDKVKRVSPSLRQY